MEQEWWRCPIRWAVGRLSGQEREVIQQLYWDECTEAEVTRELGVSQQAVSEIKKRALEKLREMLEGAALKRCVVENAIKMPSKRSKQVGFSGCKMGVSVRIT